MPIPPQPKELSVALSGEPVRASYGVDANFGAETLTTVSDAVRLTSSSNTGELKESGQIPRKALGQPIITGVTFGSLGFVMEPPAPIDDPYGTGPAEEAVRQIQELIRAASEGSDNDLTAAAAGIHPRAVNKVADLLKSMKQNNAQFSLDYQGNTVRLLTEAAVENASNRLQRGNLPDDTHEIIGTMVGVVPATRQFELQQIRQAPIHGRIGPEIRNPYEVAERDNNRRVRAQIRTVRAGRGAPRHTLFGISEPPDVEDD